jgi:hypothetical protein
MGAPAPLDFVPAKIVTDWPNTVILPLARVGQASSGWGIFTFPLPMTPLPLPELELLLVPDALPEPELLELELLPDPELLELELLLA